MKYYARHVKEYVTFFQLENELHALFELASDEIELEKGNLLHFVILLINTVVIW